MWLLSTYAMPSVCLYNVECTVLVRNGLRSDFTSLVVISILICSPEMYGSQSGSRLFILREPFSVYGSFGSRAPVFSYSLPLFMCSHVVECVYFATQSLIIACIHHSFNQLRNNYYCMP